MKIQDVMTRDVVAVSPTTPIYEAASLMVKHGISGLPVVNDRGTVVGIVSEGDLIVRQKPREAVPWWRLFLDDGERLAREYQRAAGTIVAEVMTREVMSIAPDLPIESAAAILDKRRIRRLPVCSSGKLVGIVSRGDLIKALTEPPTPPPLPPSDMELVRAMKERMAREAWVRERTIVVHADRGVLTLWGMLSTETERSALETMARSIPGARGLESHLVVESATPYHFGGI